MQTQNVSNDLENLLKDAEKLAHLGSWKVMLQSQETKWSDEVYRIFGYQPYEIEPSYINFMQHIHPEDLEYVRQITADAISGKSEKSKFNYRILDAQNSLKYIYSEIMVIRTKDGCPINLTGFIIDNTEQKINELKLQESEKRYRHLFDNNPMPMWVTDKTTKRYLNVNQAAIRHYGYSREEFLNMSALDLRPEEEKIRFLTATPQQFTSLNNKNGEWVHQKKDGTRVIAEIYAEDIVFNGREAWVILANDITEKQMAYRKLERSESHLLASQRIGNIGSWEINLSQTGPEPYAQTYWSDQTFRLFGYAPGEITPSPNFFLSRVHPDDLERVTIATTEAVSTQSSYSSKHRIIHKDGTVRYIENIAETIKDKTTGQSLKMIGVVYDITDQTLANTALKQSEANLKSIFENPDISYVLLDNELKIISFNTLANDGFLSEIGLELLPGSSFIDYIPKERKKEVYETYAAVVAGKSISYERHFVGVKGSKTWNAIQLSPVKDEMGNPLGMIFVGTNITEKKLAQIEHEKLVMDIIQRNKDLEQFTYIVSHNLRGPVANILGASNLLREETVDESDKQFLMDGLDTSVKKLDGVIHDLNNILKVRQALETAKEEVCLATLVNEIQSGIWASGSEYVQFLTDFSECESIATVKSYLHSIFYNLITNSIKYRKPNECTIIEISSHTCGEKIRIVYKDNGIGIDMAQYQNEVFGLYKRFHNHVDGKGMGLFMVKTQVETLGGKIQLNSTVNNGCEFIIDFKK